MPFNVLNYLLIFTLTINSFDSTAAFQGSLPSNILNEVSDFNDIVEKDFQSNRSPPLKEEGELTKKEVNYAKNSEFHHSYDTFEDNPNHDSVFSSSVLGDSGSCKGSLCPKHGIRYRDSGNIPEAMEETDSLKQAQPYLVRLLPNQDFDGTKEDNACENCNKIKGLLPIPLMESLLISKLLERQDGAQPYPIKYVVKAVLPNVKDISELDKPETQRCIKTYLQRRKRQLELLKKRSAKHKKKPHKKKHKKRKHGKKHKPYKRHHRSINDNFDNQLNGIADYISKNQTFNETLTYVPLLFGTVTPAEGQLLLAGVKHDASAEEKLMLEKILSIRPDTLVTNTSTEAGTQATTQEPTAQTTSAAATSIPANSSTASTDNVKYNLNLNLNSPEVKKTIMEIMQRQQSNGESYEAPSTKVKRQVSTASVAPPSTQNSTDAVLNNSTATGTVSTPAMNATLNISNGTTENGTLGLVVASSLPPNGLNILPGILIYPKCHKHLKRAADSTLLGNSNKLNDAQISSIVKSFDGFSPKNITGFEDSKSKKQCKSDKCTEETGDIIEALNSLNQKSLTLADLGVEDAISTTKSLTSSHEIISEAVEQKQVELREDNQMKEKLSKLQKDLKMVQEIQNIFDNVANAKGKEKRSAPTKSRLTKFKHSGSEPDENRYDNEISGLIKARMWQKHNKSFCEDKVKRQNAAKKRSRRFLATN
ncbi:uncharacterized protein LOC109540571 isoform X1 [Dendroctonus ponderosae]|uniref:uncharacterized protein LOC109540571 isoform X1 n=1 Tax=Dendroctonus ponderosae TaxID=77166 RepID=UPI0020354770|nr:uncharacterized protein LOC109540571 isoform X1 [Dendroctonus ponderosae]